MRGPRMIKSDRMIFALGFAACFALLQVRWGVDFARAGASEA